MLRPEWHPEANERGDQESVPKLCSVVLDRTDARTLAEFYRQLMGFV
ncbi:hypothetical protein JNW91_19380 [Micromonospora sp. STR1_7]|uniref:VOC family protein n=1 Tax=Micromonospora parastrephiae TaxID=2806101 RepID=A0ABS1XX46_9ACTN|nr:hypothetical protein [Micromonospora parastrephiae]MBM0233823.1 hypothetical protein [Micromonospora parastrephiae]